MELASNRPFVHIQDNRVYVSEYGAAVERY
jgi:hypothetical protein